MTRDGTQDGFNPLFPRWGARTKNTDRVDFGHGHATAIPQQNPSAIPRHSHVQSDGALTDQKCGHRSRRSLKVAHKVALEVKIDVKIEPCALGREREQATLRATQTDTESRSPKDAKTTPNRRNKCNIETLIWK